jgi:hypothetical protein
MHYLGKEQPLFKALKRSEVSSITDKFFTWGRC